MPRKDYSNKYLHHPLRRSQKKKKSSSLDRMSRKQRGRRRGVLIGILLFLCIIGFGYVVFYSPFFVVTSFVLDGSQDADLSLDIQQWLDEQLVNSAWGIAQSHLFFLDTNELHDILLSYPSLEYVDVYTRFPRQLVVVTRKRMPSLAYTLGAERFIIDRTGGVFELPLGDASPIPVVRGTSTDDVILDAQIISFPEPLVRFISTLYTEFPKYFDDVEISYFSLIPDTLDVRVHTSGGWYAYMTSEVDYLVQLSNLSRVYSEKISDSEKLGLEYIDVRLESYVYYK